MGRVMAAHQPNFLPYLGFFDKMKKADVFVIRDEVQFAERDWHNRNRIKIQGKDKQGNPNVKYVTVPVHKSSAFIKDIHIKNNTKIKNVPWNKFMLRQIQSSYSKAPFFKQYFGRLEEIVMDGHEMLVDLNMDVIDYLKDAFKIDSEMVLASQLPNYEVGDDADDNLVEICYATGAFTYLSGPGGRNYMNLEKYQEKGINVEFQEFEHPQYPQLWHGFVSHMAGIDALFNTGCYPCKT